MTIPPELEAQILRYHHVEKWPVGTIAKHLPAHHTTVSRGLLQAGLPRLLQHLKRPTAEPFLPFIHDTPGRSLSSGRAKRGPGGRGRPWTPLPRG